MNKSIFWGILAGLGSLLGTAGTILAGISGNKIVELSAKPVINLTEPVAKTSCNPGMK